MNSNSAGSCSMHKYGLCRWCVLYNCASNSRNLFRPVFLLLIQGLCETNGVTLGTVTMSFFTILLCKKDLKRSVLIEDHSSLHRLRPATSFRLGPSHHLLANFPSSSLLPKPLERKKNLSHLTKAGREKNIRTASVEKRNYYQEGSRSKSELSPAPASPRSVRANHAQL